MPVKEKKKRSDRWGRNERQPRASKIEATDSEQWQQRTSDQNTVRSRSRMHACRCRSMEVEESRPGFNPRTTSAQSNPRTCSKRRHCHRRKPVNGAKCTPRVKTRRPFVYLFQKRRKLFQKKKKTTRSMQPCTLA